MNPITIPNISIPTIGIPTIGIPSVGFPSASGGGGLSWPAGMKEHIKAWYDPKKQGMTNFDVIEAYVEDFSKNPWNNKTEKYVGNLTSKALTVTEVLVRSALIYTNIKPYNFKVRITGLINNQKVIFGDDTSPYRALIVDKDGIYDINWEDNHKAYCIWIDFIGECNITITQLPTSILKDFSGNGNHAYLYGGKGKLNSGMGVYQTDFSSWQFYPKLSTVEYSPEQLIIEKVNGPAQFCASSFVGKFIAEVSGIPDGVVLYYRYIDKITGNTVSTTLSNGINEIDCSNANGDVNMTNMFLIGADNKDVNITITQIPDYPDQLCYDGKMSAVAYDMPILTDYTVMADRTWFEKEEYSAFISNSLGGMEAPSNGAFSVELKSLNSFTTISFGSITSIGIPEKGVTYQTKQSYNGNSINVGTKESNDILILGGRYFYKNDNVAGNTWNGCHGAIIVADRSFTEEEINWLKQNWDKI